MRQLVRGYILAELIVALIVTTIVSAALLAGLIALIRGLQPPQVVVSGEKLPIAPTFGAFPSAVRLHQSLTDHLAAARAVYVFGGQHLSIPADAPSRTLVPLGLRTLPSIGDFARGLPMDAKSFYDRYASELGAFEPAWSAEDFTILVIGSRGTALTTTCCVQVRKHDATVGGGASPTPLIIREVLLWDDAGEQRYAFAERPRLSAGGFVGAVHTWFRYSASAGIAEEGPVCAVFPDPWVYGGRRGQADDEPAFSRFSYFIPISR